MPKEAEFTENVAKAVIGGVLHCFGEAWDFSDKGSKGGGGGDSNPFLSILGKGIQAAISEGAEDYLKALEKVTIG
jgi:hypothetical protein